ncbi:hypothetical protein P8452_48578 [Trifolium repens]|nr:hypothetical protein P8452_48578 [Trifolium repens]
MIRIKRWINGLFEGWIGSEEMSFESGMGIVQPKKFAISKLECTKSLNARLYFVFQQQAMMAEFGMGE